MQIVNEIDERLDRHAGLCPPRDDKHGVFQRPARGRQSSAFLAANSSSVSMPFSFSVPSWAISIKIEPASPVAGFWAGAASGAAAPVPGVGAPASGPGAASGMRHAIGARESVEANGAAIACEGQGLPIGALLAKPFDVEAGGVVDLERPPESTASRRICAKSGVAARCPRARSNWARQAERATSAPMRAIGSRA